VRASQNEVPVPLYHGTSSLFLEEIRQFGLGGRDPLVDLKMPEFVQELWPLVQANLGSTAIFRARSGLFSRMVEQRAGNWNFQRGQTYVSPSRETAVIYAANNRYGSELLTYTLDFLQALVDRDVPGAQDSLARKYPRLFGLLNV
jgi:hypothetical protein